MDITKTVNLMVKIDSKILLRQLYKCKTNIEAIELVVGTISHSSIILLNWFFNNSKHTFQDKTFEDFKSLYLVAIEEVFKNFNLTTTPQTIN